MHSHQSLLHSERMLEESTFTEIQFEQRKLDADISRDIMGQIQQQLADLSKDISSQETAITSAFHDFLRRLEGPTKDQCTAAALATRETESLGWRTTWACFGLITLTLYRIEGDTTQGMDRCSGLHARVGESKIVPRTGYLFLVCRYTRISGLEVEEVPK